MKHVKSIETNVEDGVVRLTGPILASEVDKLLKVVKWVKGVRQIINELDVHRSAGNVPGLQGEGKGLHAKHLDS